MLKNLNCWGSPALTAKLRIHKMPAATHQVGAGERKPSLLLTVILMITQYLTESGTPPGAKVGFDLMIIGFYNPAE